MSMTKSCRVCLKVLSLDQFYSNGKSNGYTYPECKPCYILARRVKSKLWQRTSPKNKAASTQRRRKRRAVKRGLPYVAYTAQEILTRDNAVCCLCGFDVDTSNFHIEHIVPLQVDPQLLLSYGIHEHPGDVPWNVSVAHPSCNLSKGNRMTQEDAANYLVWSYLYKE
jgi:5-methylcytosine-specific restriction endonuclease McrA